MLSVVRLGRAQRAEPRRQPAAPATPISFCTALRERLVGLAPRAACPTVLMFSYIASAIGLLKCRGHAEPRTRSSTSFVPRHHRGALRDRVADREHRLDLRVVQLAEVVPDGRRASARRSAGRRRR